MRKSVAIAGDYPGVGHPSKRPQPRTCTGGSLYTRKHSRTYIICTLSGEGGFRSSEEGEGGGGEREGHGRLSLGWCGELVSTATTSKTRGREPVNPKRFNRESLAHSRKL